MAALAVVFALAVAVRLAGTFRGAGLYGLGNYDDGVHFAAALGLVNGLLPYRDFLLLHPPGVVLAMAPFAALSWLIGEPDAMAVARVSWMLLGGVNTVLCALVLSPLSRTAGSWPHCSTRCPSARSMSSTPPCWNLRRPPRCCWPW